MQPASIPRGGPGGPLLVGRRPSGPAIAGILLFVLGVSVGANWILHRIDDASRETAARSLNTILGATRETLQHWVTREQAVVSTYAAARELTAAVQIVGHNPAKAPVEAREIDSLLEPAVRSRGLAGWWVLGLSEEIILSGGGDGEAPLPAEVSGAIDRALDGFPTVTPPYARYIYSLAPIRDRRDATTGALVWATPARRELVKLAAQSPAGPATRVILFDREGRLLAAGGNLGGGFVAGRVQDPLTGELTRMATAAVAGTPGMELQAYPDQRGTPVVGAWRWDPVLDVGVAVETNAADAYHVAETARRAVLLGLGLTLALFGLAAWALLQRSRQAQARSQIQRRFSAILQSTTDLVAFAGPTGEAIYLNAAGEALLGLEPGAAGILLRPAWLAAASRDGSWSGETRLLTPAGQECTLSQLILCHRGDDEQVEFYSTIARDITERSLLEQRLHEEKERAEVTLGSIGDGVIRTDRYGRIEYLNAVAEELLGIALAAVQGQAVEALFTLMNENSRETIENPVQIALRERRAVGRSNLSLLVRPDGREFAIDDSAAPIRDNDGRVIGAVMVFHDVSRSRTMARQLAHQATHDFLTGLVNRHEFERRVNRAISRAQQDGGSHAVCYLDLDQFKVVNDTCGHVAGDELLRQLAQALLKKVRRRDTLARLGGDEFGVLLEHCPPAQATRVAHEFLEAVQSFRFVWEGKPFTLGVSIGVVTIDAECESLANALRDADAACYAAKERGRNRVHLYQRDDAVLALRHGEMQWVTRITQAFEEQRFRLYGQPIVPLGHRPNERTQCEVLIRMVQADGALVTPGAFIPAAERYNLMAQVDRWVIRETIALYSRFRHHPWKPIASINLSGGSLGDPTMLGYVRDELAKFDLAPDTLCFEITETAAIANLAQAAHFIHELKSIGCWFALDDFGSGMSSFAYLQSLPVDVLKIAGAFLRHVETDPVEYAMVEAINRVGHVMRLKTVAEGVESQATIATLQRIGVDYAQGYAIAEPMPLEELCARTVNPGGGGERRARASSPE
jgi:diguanylate cyclase (GGDEF)-like protein/PAS domain S-box-containing protein